MCDNDFKLNAINKNNKTCSLDCKKKLHSLFNFKQNKTYAKCGYYKGIFCGSSWELAFLVLNKNLGNNIERCKLNFEYEFNNKIHVYFPDFIMNNIIYEIKGRELEDVKFKTQAVIRAGYEIKILRKKK